MKLTRAEGTPLYVVTLEDHSPKLVPRLRERDAYLKENAWAAIARNAKVARLESNHARVEKTVFLTEVEWTLRHYSAEDLKTWDRERAQRWWDEVVAAEFPAYINHFKVFWHMNETRRWVGPNRF